MLHDLTGARCSPASRGPGARRRGRRRQPGAVVWLVSDLGDRSPRSISIRCSWTPSAPGPAPSTPARPAP
ncbi:hypothetical protein HBB16_08140 [Pseudonocardia sp. MCCB 268]|nr:hypothetical protein [Pseudonocardia cytotoxica]